MKATSKNIADLLRQKIEFTGSNCHAVYEAGVYRVYSYATCIYTSANCFDNAFYSATTSKLQNTLIDVFGLNDGKKSRS